MHVNPRTGAYHHATAFTHSYVARPEVKVYADKSVMAINMNVTNLFHKSMDLMVTLLQILH